VYQVPAWRQQESPPVIELAGGGNVTAATFELRFAIRSRSRVRSVNVKHNKQFVEYAPRLEDLKPDPTGEYAFEDSVLIRLAPGDNRFEVLAANDGGAQSETTSVNYIDPPARIVIDRLETVEPVPTKLTIVTKNNLPHAAVPASSGKVMVFGRVEWSRSTDKEYLSRPQRVQVWVNGFQQAPLEMQAPDPVDLTSRFSAFAVLNQERDNKIEVALPDLTADIATGLRLAVDCAKPVHEQRLHLLIIGVGEAAGTEAALEQQVLEAVQAQKAGRDLWRTTAFDRVALYGPLVGPDITPQQIRGQLAIIKLKIDELYRANQSSARPANDVVMIYLQGGALVNVDGDFYVTTRLPSDPRTGLAMRDRQPKLLMDVAVKSRSLADFLTHTTGAHVLMLDVTGDQAAEAAARWPAESHAAMLRYTWLKESFAPPRARLLAALPSAIQSSARLAQLDSKIAEVFSRQEAAFPQSIRYGRRVPDSLQDLRVGETLTAPR
jgi:hypothetical protein